MSPAAVLVGVPGSGKTTVGQLLAGLLGVEFTDIDHVIEARAGKSVPDIFIDDGEDAFRAMEREEVASAIAGHDGVISPGGGAIMDAGTRQLLAAVPVVWLKVSTDAASKRVGLGVSRPMLMGSVRSRLVTLARERAPLYEEVATIEIETDSKTPEDIAAEIVAGLQAARS